MRLRILDDDNFGYAQLAFEGGHDVLRQQTLSLSVRASRTKSFLGAAGLWQNAPAYFAATRIDGDERGALFRIGPEIVNHLLQEDLVEFATADGSLRVETVWENAVPEMSRGRGTRSLHREPDLSAGGSALLPRKIGAATPAGGEHAEQPVAKPPNGEPLAEASPPILISEAAKAPASVESSAKDAVEAASSIAEGRETPKRDEEHLKTEDMAEVELRLEKVEGSTASASGPMSRRAMLIGGGVVGAGGAALIFMNQRPLPDPKPVVTLQPSPKPTPKDPLLRTFTGHTDLVWSVAIAPDGCAALSGSLDNTLKLWDLA